jgi:predicted ATPase
VRDETSSSHHAERAADALPAHRAGGRPLDPDTAHGGAATPHNLPHPVTPFIGRERQIAELVALLGESRLVTVTGAGGVGKTRFALQVAGEIVAAGTESSACDGVWLVELAPLADAAFLPQAVATALGVREEPGAPLLGTLLAFLQERRPLIVLDNCEHLIDACADLAHALLRGCPGVRILATSREALNLAAEVSYRLPSLAAPDPAGRTEAPEALAAFEVVRLFVDRARAVSPGFALTRQNGAAVASICARLDGIALAIELAAALVRVLPVQSIQERLSDRFRLLTGGSRSAPPRHQTLRAAIDWSYDLLTESEQGLLRRLSVFSGAASLEAIEAICDTDLDCLTRLVDKSLVVVASREGEARYRLLETIRQYGAEKLEAVGDTTNLRTRHREWYTKLAREAPSSRTVSERGRWLERLEREHDNLRGALEWVLAVGDAAAGFRLSEGMAPLWNVRGHRMEGIRLLVRLLALPDATAPSAARCRALDLLGEVNWHHQDLPAMRAAYAEMLEVAGAIGSIPCRAAALCGLGVATASDGGSREAERVLLTESVTLFRQTDSPRGLAAALGRLGHMFLRENLDAAQPLLQESLVIYDAVGGEDQILVLEWQALYLQGRGELSRARALFEQNLTTSQELGFSLGSWWSQLRLADLDSMQGNVDVARETLVAMLARERAAGSRGNVAILLQRLGDLARQQEDDDAALACYEECVALRRALGSKRDLAHVLGGLGELLRQRGDIDRAKEMFTERLALRREQEDRGAIARALRSLGDLATARGDRGRAAGFYAEADALSGDAGATDLAP